MKNSCSNTDLKLKRDFKASFRESGCGVFVKRIFPISSSHPQIHATLSLEIAAGCRNYRTQSKNAAFLTRQEFFWNASRSVSFLINLPPCTFMEIVLCICSNGWSNIVAHFFFKQTNLNYVIATCCLVNRLQLSRINVDNDHRNNTITV